MITGVNFNDALQKETAFYVCSRGVCFMQSPTPIDTTFYVVFSSVKFKAMLAKVSSVVLSQLFTKT